MNENQRKILEMLAEKKITVDEAQRLLSVLQSEPDKSGHPERGTGKQPGYLRVVVRPNPEAKDAAQENVNIRVPLSLIRAGMKLASIIPPGAYNQVDSALKDKGIDFDLRNLKPENLEEMLEALKELQVEVQNDRQTVHIYAE